MLDQRPNPEELLKRNKEEERKESSGKLKIYLGAAPGVGKTYAMLHDALENRNRGLDVVVGIAESHGREDIDAVLTNFEILPRQQVAYRGTTAFELDLDAALQRDPGLILIDEMAHSNVPGLRHAKRWQDIRELLDRGINVYTTLNVQHIESLKDTVSQIIQAPIRETVPDSMIEMANAIELVDLPPEELLKRLHDGKVYIPKQVELATEHFFRKGNLIALRELALRTTAERVGTDVLLYRQSEGIKQIWPTKEKMLVCVGPNIESLKLIRAAKRMANSLQAEWIAVYVDTPRLQSSTTQRNNAIQNLRLAEQLGAVTHVLTGFDIATEILNFAHEQNVTQILVWKHIFMGWSNWFRRSLADEILRHTGEIDVYIMTGSATGSRTKKRHFSNVTSWKSYGMTTAIVILATFFNLLISPLVGTSNLLMVYLLSVVIVARLGRVGPSIFASILSVLAYDYFFVVPVYSFAVAESEYYFTLFIMLIVAQVIGYLTILTRRQDVSARLLQHQTTALYTLSRQLTKARGVKEIVSLGTHYIAEVFNCDVVALLPGKRHLEILDVDQTHLVLDAKEQSIAQWVYEMGQIAGLGTDTLSFSHAVYLPLLAAQGTIGVLRIQPKTPQLFTPEQTDLLESCVQQLSLALEVDRLHEKTKKKEIKIKTEQARFNLLEAISNDLHTPLKVIVRAATTLKEQEIKEENVRKTGKDIDFEIEKLSQLNNNISRIIQLEFQDLKLEKTWVVLQDIVNFVINLSLKSLKDRPVYNKVSSDLPPVPANEGLVQEVMRNLLDNAIKFTPSKSPITISASVKQKMMLVSVEDCGPGVAPEEMNRLFEKFYRGKQVTTVRGLGLGLAICHKIIEEHGGRIWVENGETSGAIFHFTLPLEERAK